MNDRFHGSRVTGFLAAALSLCIAGTAWSGTSGKVAGHVVDADGQPLPGVAVTIEGTRLGATTDADGRYIILLVPPGQVTATAQFIGYRPTTITHITVNADLTAQVDFVLHQEAIEVEAVVVRAKRPPIEADVTSSQTIVDAQRVAEAPVATMLDYLTYEPGVNLIRGNELTIRGGGPSEIRFQVDGLDRTDALTSKAYTQLNQVLVSEVTLLTGGFNAEYGNVRSGMVNVVNKDGTERGGQKMTLPWVSGVVGYAPAHKKHFGPGAYDENEYDYWLMSSKSPFADSALVGPLYWPLLYDETKNDPEFNDPNYDRNGDGIKDYRNPRSSQFRVFRGWKYRAMLASAANRRGSYGKNDWTPEETRQAWEWEANMNEQVWRYSNEPDRNLDLAIGWAIPHRLGGLVFGYTYAKEMTPVPALRPYFRDETFEGKLTLTPSDALKVQFNGMQGRGASTGAGSKGTSRDNPELNASGASVFGSDPVSLRDTGLLVSTVKGITTGNNKLHLSYNGPLDSKFSQVGVSLTYTFSPKTFVTASVGRSSSNWNLPRDLPRVNVKDFTHPYQPPTSFGFGDWLSSAYGWSDVDGNGRGDPPVSLEDALTPGRAIFRHPFYIPNVYDHIPTEGKYVTKKFPFIGTDGKPDTAVVVSPQGYVQGGYSDLSGTYTLGTGGEVTLFGRASQYVLRSDITHVVRDHTLKAGLELMTAELEYHTVQSSALMGSPQYTDFRDYGGTYPTPRPEVLGIYLQDKFETHGMIANAGVRVERFDANQQAYDYTNMFDARVFGPGHGKQLFEEAVYAAGWDTTTMGPVPVDYLKVKRELNARGDAPPLPPDVVARIPRTDAMAHWRLAPRFGISHPVSDRTKFFFNYGIFYSMQKAAVMYGFSDHDGRLGYAGSLRDLYNPNLRPAKTTMYEVGIEHVLPAAIVATLRAYAKYNVDQVSNVRVNGEELFGGYTIYRNANYEDIRGAEIKLSRSVGRFVNGWLSYEHSASRSGFVGLENVDDRPTNIAPFTGFVRTSDPQAFIRGLLRVGTPTSWGPASGGWSISLVQSYSSGGQVIYNPDLVPERELPKEFFLRAVDYWNTDLKLTKNFQLPAGRMLSAYLDVTNLWNTRRLNGGGTSNYGEYLKYVVQRHRKGDNIRVGEETEIFTRPFRNESGSWEAPLSPRSDWLMAMNPRAVRFGLRFDL